MSKAEPGIKRTARRLGKALLVIIIMAAVLHGIATIVLGRRLEARLAQLKAEGQPMSGAELMDRTISPSENAAVVYNQIFDKLRNAPIYGYELIDPNYANKTPEMWASARSAISNRQGALSMVDKALARPKCRFDVDWSKGPGVLLPHLKYLRDLNRLLVVDAILQARDGNASEYTKRLEQAIKLISSLKDEPSVISFLVRSANLTIALRGLEDATHYCALTSSQAERLAKDIQQIDVRGNFVDALSTERAVGLQAFNQLRANVYPMTILFHADELAYIREMQRLMDDARLPRQSRVNHKGKRLGLVYSLTNIVVPMFDRALQRADMQEAALITARAYLATLAYKDRTGKLPESINQATQTLGWPKLSDTFTGRELFYKRSGNGFIVYSIGVDLKDDGGKPAKLDGSPNDDKGDIVMEWSPLAL